MAHKGENGERGFFEGGGVLFRVQEEQSSPLMQPSQGGLS